MDSIRYRPRYATQADLASATAVSSQSEYVTLNRTTNAVVASGGPVIWDPANASQYLNSGRLYALAGSIVLPAGEHTYNIDVVQVPGNATLDFVPVVNGVQVHPIVLATGVLTSCRFRTAAASLTNVLQILNATAGNVTMTGVSGDAYISVTML